MSLGIPVIDASHRRFLLKLHEATTAIDMEFTMRFYALLEELEHGFNEEEAVMESIHFYDLKSHREQHTTALQVLHRVVPDILRGEFTHARTTLKQFPKWFLYHISTMDRLMSVWFRLKKTDMTLEMCGHRTEPVLGLTGANQSDAENEKSEQFQHHLQSQVNQVAIRG